MTRKIRTISCLDVKDHLPAAQKAAQPLERVIQRIDARWECAE